ncbi:hypothetical protein DV737_g4023, partial [Chaetothyriales sp. CBS 132003]
MRLTSLRPATRVACHGRLILFLLLVFPSVFVFVFPSVFIFIFPSRFLFIFPSRFLFIFPSRFLFVFPPLFPLLFSFLFSSPAMALAVEPTAHLLSEEADFRPSGPQVADAAAIIPEIYREKPEEEAQWWKIHLRGTDDLSTDDLLALVRHYAPDADVHIQWVNDTAANVVCKGSDNMQHIFLKLVDADLAWPAVAAAPFALRMARQHPSRTATMLQMRVAQAGDRKKKNAAVESRYYLLHPGEDPTERMRQEFNSNRGEYRRRRGDEREQRRRRDADLAAATTEFSASMYDDAPSAADQQTTATQSRGRDLFSRVTRRRSASPRTRNATDSRAENAAVAKRLKADLLSAAQTSPRSNHRRSHAMDAKNEEDLVERFARKTLSIDSTRSHGSANSHGHGHNHTSSGNNGNHANTGVELFPSSNNSNFGFSIKGAAAATSAAQGLLIKAKELFPHLYTGRKRSAGGGGAGGNEGKELFDEPVREKRVRRRAGDLFD